MSDIGGFEWWFSGEYGRDQILRDRYESVQADASAARARTSRLSSQLSQLQGSIEKRLDALSEAFDAYVELGDIREQLTPYADSAAVRRDAMAAIAALGEGRPIQTVDDRGTGYWIAAATNAVTARASGRPDVAAEQTLAAQHREAELFMVAAAGAIDRGAEVADRVPGCLQPIDGRLDDRQLALWQAVLQGRYGDQVPHQVLSSWSQHLAGSQESWWQWAADEASAAKLDVLDWIADQPDWIPELPDREPAANAPVDGSGMSGLQQIVMELISVGNGAEQALLTRARELRAKIEDPDGQRAGSGLTGNGDQRPAGSVLDVVRGCYRQAPPGSPARIAILQSAAPALSAAVEAAAPRLLTAEPASVVVRIGGRSVPVGPAGPDREELARATTSARTGSTNPRIGMYVGAAVALIAAIVGLIGAIASVNAGTVVLLLVIAVIGGAVGLRFWLRERREQQERIAEEQRWTAQIAQAQERASAIERDQRELVQSRAGQLDRARITLSSFVA